MPPIEAAEAEADTIQADVGDDRHADLAAAFDNAEELVTDAAEVTVETTTEETVSDETTTAPEAAVSETPADAPPAAEPTAAPVSWSPLAREEWANVPEAVKTQIAAREQHVDTIMRENADFKGVNDNVGKLFTPFQSMFQAQGLDAWQGTYQVLQMAASLQGGNKVQKAQTAAQIIKDFGVDIAALDDLLTGQMPQTSHGDEIADLRNQLNQQNQWMQNQTHIQQAQFNQAQTVTDTETEAFVSSHEFAPELRGVMADFMDMAEANGGAAISLDEAYNRALGANPEMQQVIKQRQSQQSSQAALAGARSASVSVPQTSGTGAKPPEPGNMRDAISAAWEN